MTKENIAPKNGQAQVDGGVARREFLTRVGATGAAAVGASLGALALWQQQHRVPGFEDEDGMRLPDFSVNAVASAPTLAIAHCNTIPSTPEQDASATEATIRAAIGALGGMERFIKNGDVVLIKPNVAFDRPAALGATTHPDTLSTVAKMALCRPPNSGAWPSSLRR